MCIHDGIVYSCVIFTSDATLFIPEFSNLNLSGKNSYGSIWLPTLYIITCIYSVQFARLLSTTKIKQIYNR